MATRTGCVRNGNEYWPVIPDTEMTIRCADLKADLGRYLNRVSLVLNRCRAEDAAVLQAFCDELRVWLAGEVFFDAVPEWQVKVETLRSQLRGETCIHIPVIKMEGN